MQGVGVEQLRQVQDLLGRDIGVISAAVAALLVLLLAYVVVRRLRRKPGEQFRAVLDDLDEVVVLLHPNPDPDAMASGIAVSHLAEQIGTDATVQFPGQIRRQENRAFRTVLDLDIEQIEHVSELAAESVVLVDHNEPRGFPGADGILPVAVVDHHPGGGSGEEFTDVRTDYGACASIVAEYFQNLGAVPVPPDQHDTEVDGMPLPTREATGLLYGILSDTDHLTSGCCAADFAAAGYLHPGIDDDQLNRIANPQVDTETLEIKARAIAGREVEGSFAVSNVGAVSNVDAIPQAANELVSLEGVTAVVVYGKKDGTIHLSGRSRDDRVHMGRALGAAVEDLPRAEAGGHARMAGGQVQPAVQADGNEQVGADEEDLDARLFNAMAGEV